jgi:hypothetical protein
MPRSKQASPVAPIESVEEAPNHTEDVIEVTKQEITDPCWNCGSQLTDGKCDDCGFDKSLLHNLDLEAEQAVKRQQAAQEANK